MLGRCSVRTSRIRSSSLQSASTGTAVRTCRSSSSSRRIWNRLSSAWSTKMRARGATREIWRHSSDPIDPPAPVTITTCPERYAPTRSISIRTGSRPSMSSTRTSRSWRVTFSCPEPSWSSSNTVGIVRTWMPRSRHAVTTRARSVPGAEGIAITTSSGSTSSRIRARSSDSVVPSTFRPCSSLIPCRRGSSSTNPTGRRRSPGLRTSSRTTSRPPWPPPTISASRAPLATRKLCTRPSTTMCTRNRAPMSNASASRKNSAITLPGSVTGLAWSATVKCL